MTNRQYHKAMIMAGYNGDRVIPISTKARRSYALGESFKRAELCKQH